MLEIERVTAEVYKKRVSDRRVFFNEPDFTELNKDKVDDIHYLILKKGNSDRFGLILGEKNGIAKSPFSAPYAYPVVIGSGARVEAFDEALEAIEQYCLDLKISEIRFTFPPFLYDEDVLSVWMSSMYRRDFVPLNIDINYTLDLGRLNVAEYQQLITKKGRSHLRKALNSNIEVIECVDEAAIKEAYDIILQNHTAKSRPTHMTLEQLKQTFELVPHDIFLARLDGEGIASMIYYAVTKEIVQCIYSGYLLEYSNSGVMNLLTWYAIQYFGNKGYKYIDRAIATEDSIPNYGLCDFKESVGGKRSLKCSFYKKFL